MARWIVFILFLSPVPPAAGAGPDLSVEIVRSYAETLRASGGLTLEGTEIAALVFLPELYERRNFELAWTSPGRIDEMIDLIRRADQEGLHPEDYHHAALRRLRKQADDDDRARAQLDLLLTDSLFRYTYHQLFGRVDPEELDSDWNLSLEFETDDPTALIQTLIDSDSIERAVTDLAGRGPIYGMAKALLAEYRGLASRGGWPVVPAGPTLKPGAHGPRVQALRERLSIGGDLPAAAADDPARFDEPLEKAVRRFQNRHGLEVDGWVGPGTLAALNVSVDERIDQIRLNLERLRWAFRNLWNEDEFVLVNIADYRAALVRKREIVWTARAQVGKPYRKTPVFRAELKYLVFNPTWTVPPGILTKDILPKMRSDPGYLERSNMQVLTHSGDVVDPSSVDWSRYPGRPFPYVIRQDPGPKNALGLVKFIFPNPHFVFLHDTPQRHNFDRAERAFSSGCIRVDRPFELARLLLDDDKQWNDQTIRSVVDSGETRTVFLDDPLPVILLYWTVNVLREEGPYFFKDIYDRDARLLAVLDGPVHFRQPAVATAHR